LTQIQNNTEDVSIAPIVGVFVTDKKYRTPSTFELYLKRTASLPEVVIFLNLKKKHIPSVEDKDRFQLTAIVPGKVFYLTISLGFSETMGSMVIPSFILSGTSCLPQINDIEKITLFAPAETIKVVSTFLPLRLVLLAYMVMKALFFGGFRVKFPRDHTIYISSIATL